MRSEGLGDSQCPICHEDTLVAIEEKHGVRTFPELRGDMLIVRECSQPKFKECKKKIRREVPCPDPSCASCAPTNGRPSPDR